jgi:hypothetical protein
VLIQRSLGLKKPFKRGASELARIPDVVGFDLWIADTCQASGDSDQDQATRQSESH